jgi:hypothetical protein
VKSFGSKVAPAPAAREPFEFTFMRDDEPEVHQFQARAVTDAAGVAATLAVAERHPEQAFPRMLRMIGTMLDNKDGTPAKWEPVALKHPGKPDPSVAEHDAERDHLQAQLDEWERRADAGDDDYVTKFRGPDGQLHPMDRAARFLEFEAGSSRRRWFHLMNEDDEITVDAKELTKLFEWLVGLAANRPTRPSS